MFSKIKISFTFVMLMFAANIFAQTPNTRVEIEPSLLKIDETLAINVIITNSDLYNVAEFPDIKNFKKLTRSIKHLQVVVNQKKVAQHIVSQLYAPEKAGKFLIPNLNIEVNQKNILAEGKSVTIMALKEDVLPPKTVEYEDVQLVLENSKSKIYVGEGEKITLGFYLSENTTTHLEFPNDISLQIEAIAKRIKPKDCLESRKNITNINEEKVVVNGKNYNYYRLFESIYYPLNDKTLVFPSVSLNMQKQVGNNKTLKQWQSKSMQIQVMKLPEHPLKDQVAVGTFSLAEQLKSKTQYTGQNFEYKITIKGDGNFNALNINKVENSKQFEFYPTTPTVNQQLGDLYGSKEFGFKVIPKDSGNFNFSNIINFIYFNVDKGKYDTLKSDKNIKVLGEAMKDNDDVVKDIYSNIENLKTDSREIRLQDFIKLVGNAIVVAMALFLVYILKRKNEQHIW